MTLARTALCLVALTAACGSLRPASTQQAGETSTGSTAQLTAVEGVPAGLVLRLQTEVTADSVELYKVYEGGEPQQLKVLEVSDAIAGSLVEGLDIIDSTIESGASSYQMYLVVGEEVVATSDVLDVAWAPKPPRIPEVSARTPFPDVVELSWSSSATFGAVIFRRDVLDQESAFERVGRVSAGQTSWVDRGLRPAQVWSYRVALSFEHPDGLVQYGQASEEVYASTPEPQ